MVVEAAADAAALNYAAAAVAAALAAGVVGISNPLPGLLAI